MSSGFWTREIQLLQVLSVYPDDQEIPAPMFSSLDFDSGEDWNARTLTAFGSGFEDASSLTVDGDEVSYTVNNDSEVEFDLPARIVAADEIVSIVITTPGGMATAQYTYTKSPYSLLPDLLLFGDALPSDMSTVPNYGITGSNFTIINDGTPPSRVDLGGGNYALHTIGKSALRTPSTVAFNYASGTGAVFVARVTNPVGAVNTEIGGAGTRRPYCFRSSDGKLHMWVADFVDLESDGVVDTNWHVIELHEKDFGDGGSADCSFIIDGVSQASSGVTGWTNATSYAFVGGNTQSHATAILDIKFAFVRGTSLSAGEKTFIRDYVADKYP